MTNYKNNLDECATASQQALSLRIQNARLESLRAERDQVLNEFLNTQPSDMAYRELNEHDKVPPRKVIRDPMEERSALSPELQEHISQEEVRKLNEDYREAIRNLDELRESMPN
jgi:hypothetical protein